MKIASHIEELRSKLEAIGFTQILIEYSQWDYTHHEYWEHPNKAEVELVHRWDYVEHNRRRVERAPWLITLYDYREEAFKRADKLYRGLRASYGPWVTRFGHRDCQFTLHKGLYGTNEYYPYGSDLAPEIYAELKHRLKVTE